MEFLFFSLAFGPFEPDFEYGLVCVCDMRTPALIKWKYSDISIHINKPLFLRSHSFVYMRCSLEITEIETRECLLTAHINKCHYECFDIDIFSVGFCQPHMIFSFQAIYILRLLFWDLHNFRWPSKVAWTCRHGEIHIQNRCSLSFPIKQMFIWIYFSLIAFCRFHCDFFLCLSSLQVC